MHCFELDKKCFLALDQNQIRAVTETVDGIQRIRGLSGSGKSTVLALKAAYIHVNHPEWKIGVTYSTLSARNFYLNTIEHFYRNLTGVEPNWANLTVCQAWGVKEGKNENAGMYQICCSINRRQVRKYLKDKTQMGVSEAFDEACAFIVDDIYNVKMEIFDILLIDESQDFPVSFLRLCYSMLRNPKRLVFAYDELQNFRLQPLLSPEAIFGSDDHSMSAESDYEPHADIVLGKCYERPPAILMAAHAFAFGIYRESQNGELSIVQMFEIIHMWKDMGYEVLDGCLDYGKRVVMGRSRIGWLDRHSDIDDQMVFKSFKSKEEHDTWVVKEIKRNLTNEGMQAQDIMVIVPERLKIVTDTQAIQDKLRHEGIPYYLVGEDFAKNEFWNGVFWKRESISICSLLKARSNEAPMVYIIDAQTSFFSKYDTAGARNLLYSAMTRSTARVRVVGFGKQMDGLLQEYDRIKNNGFKFDFVYPTKQQQSYMRAVFREAEDEPFFVEYSRIEKIVPNSLKSMKAVKLDFGDDVQFEALRHWL
ncbi:MAG: ATP-binding domain-containing protein [Clostridiales bacterium]|jgi:superfamily I DNA and RNA helicase|nr:ATP-binding domain-containing protein [Clostridiales bacterium]